MAEPFSVSSGAIGIIAVALQVSNGIIQYYNSYKRAPKAIDAIKTHVTNLTRVLDLLRSVIHSNPHKFSRNTWDQVEDYILSCELGVQKLEKKLMKCKTTEAQDTNGLTNIKSAGKRLIYPFRESTIAKFREMVSELIDPLSLALDALQITQNSLLAAEIGHIGRDVDTISANVRRIQQEQYREKVDKWLGAPDPSLNHNNACEKRQQTTGSWVMEGKQYFDWKLRLNSLLWIHGIEFSSNIVEHIKRDCHFDPTLRLAYFYFDFKDEKTKHYKKLICSLILQLSARQSDHSKPLERLYARNNDGEQQPNVDQLVTTLRDILEDSLETYIILDALDECVDRQELLKLIQQFVDWKIESLHVLVTSRKERDIETALDPLCTGQISVHDAQDNHDIEMYIDERLKSDSKLKMWPVKIREEINERLKSDAHGMFQWVVCQLDALRRCVRLDRLRKALKSLPQELDETYDRILQNLDSENAEDAFTVLQWLTFSLRAVQIEEIAAVISVDVECDLELDVERSLIEPRALLEICSSLVTTSNSTLEHPSGERNRIEELRLSHFSVKEYLTSERIRSRPTARFGILEIPAHLSIAQTCLAYLLQFNKPDSLASDTFSNYPLARYAAQYWSEHAKIVEQHSRNEALDVLAKALFRSDTDCFLNWIRIFDHEHPWDKPDFSRPAKSVAPRLYYASLLGHDCIVQQLLEEGAENINAEGAEFGNALQAAVQGGHTEVVHRLIRSGANVNLEGGYFGNSLQAAAFQGTEQTVQLLLDQGAHVTADVGYYGNAIQAASFEGHERIVQLLLDRGSDVMVRGGYYGYALHAASREGREQVVHLLLRRGAEVNAQGEEDFVYALQAASFGGYEKVVQLLLENGAEISAQSEQGNAVQEASAAGHENVVRLLLNKGADAAADCGYYGNALQAASHNGHEKIVQLLVDLGINVSAEGGYYGNALQAASHGGHARIVEMLLDKGVDVDIAGGFYGNALQAASRAGHGEIVKLLLDRGADVMAEGGQHGNALKAASYGGHLHAVHVLVKSGASPNTSGGRKRSALHLALRADKSDVIDYLFDCGLDHTQTDQQNCSAIHHAASGGSMHGLRKLLALDVDPNAPDSYGWTSLHWATVNGHGGAIQLLLEAGADPWKVDREERAPLHIAIHIGNESLISDLSAAMKKLSDAEGTTTEEGHAQNRSTKHIPFAAWNGGVRPIQGGGESSTCDNCFHKIYGTRYSCEECIDLDYCFRCVFDKDIIHPDHEFTPVED
ncbi:hypothetical protein MMC22_010690 [Lobaria immixta]|nr:hypothetical protein [Lobaria immixta]